ncbi:MAG TPA: hypothetical protein PLQ76_02310 [bacterium]|nr:hypothetical protein [bacterium]
MREKCGARPPDGKTMNFSDVNLTNLSVTLKDLGATRSGLMEQGVYRAKVVDFQGGKPVLEIDGRTVVAESDSPLALNSEIDLAVRGYDSSGKVQLQVVANQELSVESTPVQPLTDSMISSRLMMFDLPENSCTLDSAKALIKLGVPVTKQNMEAMLSSLPQKADQKTIEFAASLLKENLPLTKETLKLAALISRELETLPENMKQVARAASVASDPALASLAPLQGDDPASILEGLPPFVKAFLSSTESRLATMLELNISLPDGADSKLSFTENLSSILSLASEPPDESSAAVERAISNLAENISSQKFSARDAEFLDSIRNDFTRAIKAALELPSQAERIAGARDAAANALAATLEYASSQFSSESPSTAATQQLPSLFDNNLAQFPKDIQNIFDILQKIFPAETTTSKNENPVAPAETSNSTVLSKEQTLSLLSSIARLSVFKIDAKAAPELANLISDSMKWAAETIKNNDTSAASENTSATPAKSQEAVVIETRLKEQLESTTLRQQIDVLARRLGEPGDLRLALARAVQTGTASAQTSTAAMDLARALQSAGFANLAQHTGAAPQVNSYIAFFPIQIGDKVEIGKLKIYHRDDELRERGKGPKPLNPFDARLTLILDTEFLGLTSVTLQTYPNKGIKCDIETQDARRKKIIDKHLDELREALSNTAYEQNTIASSVRRRKSVGAEGDESGDSPGAAAVDLRV